MTSAARHGTQGSRGRRHEVLELSCGVPFHGVGAGGMGVILEGRLQLSGCHPREAEGHSAGAVHAGGDGRHPGALLRQCVAERAVSDEVVPPSRSTQSTRNESTGAES
jgi:hypothetical protein